jgi:two-component system sensor histidine kinase KdpD
MPDESAVGGQMRGRLKVFLGYASGVGKSYRMFDEARRRKERGQDVIIGALQPRVPDEIRTLVSSSEVVPTLDSGGVPVIDVEAILRRRPQVCVVDGLAYDNPPGSRNAHRWQDIEELLAAGINVVGSVNLQFIDDQRDAVARITGKTVTPTIPRSFLNGADEIVIVDIPSEALSEQAIRLREMALLLSADVIEAGLQRYLHSHGIESGLGMREKFLVCLTPHSNAERMIASGLRNAGRFHCDLLVVYVEQSHLTPSERTQLENYLAQARSAGAHVDVLQGQDPIEAILKYARSHSVTQIFVGHSLKSNPWTRIFGSPVNRLIRSARDMDVRVFPH